MYVCVCVCVCVCVFVFVFVTSRIKGKIGKTCMIHRGTGDFQVQFQVMM